MEGWRTDIMRQLFHDSALKMSILNRLTFVLAVSVATSASFAQDIKGDAKAGETKNAMCIGCHGIQGYQSSFPEVYKVPRIAGQSESFIASSLKAYRSGERKHPTMRAVAGSLTDQDIADLSIYYEQQGGEPAKIADKAPDAPADVAALLTKGACASCHGANFNKPIAPGYPKIAGQYADYLYVALKSYKADGNATWGRNNAVMGGIAKQFTLAELKTLSKYMANQPGDVKTIAQNRFR